MTKRAHFFSCEGPDESRRPAENVRACPDRRRFRGVEKIFEGPEGSARPPAILRGVAASLAIPRAFGSCRATPPATVPAYPTQSSRDTPGHMPSGPADSTRRPGVRQTRAHWAADPPTTRAEPTRSTVGLPTLPAVESSSPTGPASAPSGRVSSAPRSASGASRSRSRVPVGFVRIPNTRADTRRSGAPPSRTRVRPRQTPIRARSPDSPL